jgi:hypothetical protein
LPDGKFSYKKIGYVLEGPEMDIDGIFYDHLVEFMAICCILCSFGKNFPVWYVVGIKIWHPCCRKLSTQVMCKTVSPFGGKNAKCIL